MTKNISKWCWVVALSCCWCNCMLYGISRLSGLLLVYFVDNLKITRAEASIPFSVSTSFRSLCGPVAGYAAHRLGIRLACAIGCILASLGLGLCFFQKGIISLIIFIGIFFGTGYGIVTTLLPQLINQNFEKYRSTASGVAYSGAFIGSSLFPFIVDPIMCEYGFSGSFLLLSGIALQALIGVMFFTLPSLNEPKKPLGRRKSIYQIDAQNLRSLSIRQKYKDNTDEDQFTKEIVLIKHKTEALDNDNIQGFKCRNQISPQLNGICKSLNPIFPKDFDKDVNKYSSYLKDNEECLVDLQKLPKLRKYSVDFLDVSPRRKSIKFYDSNPGKRHLIKDINYKIRSKKLKKVMKSVAKSKSHSYTLPKSPRQCKRSNERVIDKELVNIQGITAKGDFVQLTTNTVPFTEKELSRDLRVSFDIPPNSKSIIDISLVRGQHGRFVPIVDDNFYSSIAGVTPQKRKFCKGFLRIMQVFRGPMFCVVCITSALMAFCVGCLLTIIVDFAKDLGVPDQQLYLVLMTLSLADLCGTLTVGWVTDRAIIPRRFFVILCYVILSVTSIVIANIKSLAGLLGLVTLFGLCEAGVLINSPLLLVEYIEFDQQVLAIASRDVLSAPTALLVPFVLSSFRDRLGSYNPLFYLISAALFTCAILWIIVPHLATKRLFVKEFMTVKSNS